MPPDTSAHDSRAWTGPQPGDWPAPDDWLPPPRRVEVWRSPSKLASVVVLNLVFIASVALAWTRIADPTVPTTFGAIGASIVALAVALHHWRLRKATLANGDPLIVLDARCLRWPETLDVIVPWRDVVNVDIVGPFVGPMYVPPPMSGLFIGLRNSARLRAATVGLPWNGLRSNRIRLPWSLDRNRSELHDLVQAFRAHHAN